MRWLLVPRPDSRSKSASPRIRRLFVSNTWGGRKRLFADGTIAAAFKVEGKHSHFERRHYHELRACR
jgi:hypothetical protein